DGTISNASSTTVGAVQVRSLSLSKSASPTTFTAAGATIHYGYVVTNTGNVALAGPVTVTDSLAGVTCPSGGLAARASRTRTATSAVTSADVARGSVTKAATAHASGTGSNRAEATASRTAQPPPPPPVPQPRIGLSKTPSARRVPQGGTAH